MSYRLLTRTAPAAIVAGTLSLALAARPDAAQQPPATPAQAGQAQPAAGSARASAPFDPTGYWVAVVTEDWRWRMVTPQKGDYASVPLSPEGRRVADMWDLAKDNEAGNQCKAFGVGGIMRQPGRLHITWQDDSTLKIDFDAGTQTRLLQFDKSKQPAAEKTWQGHSRAEWEIPVARGRGAGGGGGGGNVAGPRGRAAPVPRGGSLKVVTSNFREAYLRKNGVPYSESATITEYFDRLPPHPNGDVWLMVITTIEDPKYLNQPFYTSTHFKLEPNGSKWSPTPCQTDPPARIAAK
jgi:hypothetical protein